jgi:c-di-GMP phosphodiesterase
MESYVARQPIFDRELDTYGYELLFRRAGASVAAVDDADVATSTTLTSVSDIGLDALVGARRAFVNVPRAFLLDGHARLLPPDRVVLEVLEDVAIDDAVMDALRDLAAGGYSLAADDFVLGEHNGSLLDVIDIVKLDVQALALGELDEHVARLAPTGARLLAEKVETHEEHERCRRLGFELFQGYFFCRPTTHSGRSVSSSRLSRLQLLARLQDPDVGRAELAAIVALDVGLSYRVLRYVNSAAVGLRRRVDSIAEALVLLGHATLRSLATVIALAESKEHPREVLVTALVRARTCERLAPRAGVEPSTAFTVGLFSVVDALMDAPIEVVLDELPFSAEINAALLEGAGPLGAMLARVRAYEEGALGVEDAPEVELLRDAYVQALAWAGGETARLGEA